MDRPSYIDSKEALAPRFVRRDSERISEELEDLIEETPSEINQRIIAEQVKQEYAEKAMLKVGLPRQTIVLSIQHVKIKKWKKDNRWPINIHRIYDIYEGLDYDINENLLYLRGQITKRYKHIIRTNGIRWTIYFLIGILTACVACFINIMCEILTSMKFAILSEMVDEQVYGNIGALYAPLLFWICFNSGPVIFAATLILYVEPIANGSGIPYVKCYLNGISLPQLVRLKTLVVKSIALICSMIGGLAGGKEGPMIHVGAVVGAQLADWKVKCGKKKYHFLKHFGTDHEKRDFVAAGAAAGVAAAFGGPIGALLFCLEEGTSFWNQALTWRIFLAASMSTISLNFIMTAYKGHIGELNHRGLMNLGFFADFHYAYKEIPIFMMIGVTGGLLGSLWNYMNYKLTLLRKMYMSQCRAHMIMEAGLIASCSAAIGFLEVYLGNYCVPAGVAKKKNISQLYCNGGETNAMAAILFQNTEGAIRSFLHDDLNTIPYQPLLIFFVTYYFLSCWTYGMSGSLGLVLPQLMTGASWGRLIGIVIIKYKIMGLKGEPGKYALIGACAQLGGVVRMTLSLTVIIMETTGNVDIGFPVVITLMCAKWTADSFIKSIYELVIYLAGLPFMAGEPAPFLSHILCSEIMSYPLTTLDTIDTIENVLNVLQNTEHNGFPIVDILNEGMPLDSPRRLKGVILRSQILAILSHRIFVDLNIDWRNVSADLFFDDVVNIKNQHFSSSEKKYKIDFRPFMNPSPFTILYSCSYTRAFNLFRGLGLRHLLVVDDGRHVIGMISRKDLAKYRFDTKFCKVHLDHIYIDKS